MTSIWEPDIDYNSPLLPHSTPIEQQVLGYILFELNGVYVALEKLTSEHFYVSTHRKIWEACVMLTHKSHPVSIISVSEELESMGELIGIGRDYINELAISAPPTDATLPYLLEQLQDLLSRRQLIELSYEVIASSSVSSSGDVLSLLNAGLMNVNTYNAKSKDLTTPEVAEESLKQIEEIFYGRSGATVSSGFHKLDKLINSGFRKGSLNILGARPSMGKTTLAVNFARNISLINQLSVCFFTIEVNAVDLGEKFIRSIAGPVQQFSDFQPAKERFAESSIVIYDRPVLTLSGIKSSLAMHKSRFGSVDFVVVDYLQLMEGPGSNREAQVSSFSRGLKAIAREYDCPVLCLSQLSRKVESRDDKVPMLSDLRDSGAVEQDADLVMFVYRDDYYNKQSLRPGRADIIIAKQRNGQQNVTLEMAFKPAVSRFE